MARHTYFLIIGTLFFVAGAVYSYVAVQADRELAESGQLTDGTVLARRVSRSDPSRAQSSRNHVVEFRFDAPWGQVIDEAKVDETVWERLQEGATIQVTYVASQPDLYRVEGEAAAFQIWKLLICVAGVVLNAFLYLRLR